MEQTVFARGGSDFTPTDFDNMPYTAAVLKVRIVPVFCPRLGLTVSCRGRNLFDSILHSIRITGKLPMMTFFLCQSPLFPRAVKCSTSCRYPKGSR